MSKMNGKLLGDRQLNEFGDLSLFNELYNMCNYLNKCFFRCIKIK